jgi:hypothetical protein
MKKLFFIPVLFISIIFFQMQAAAQLLTLDTIAGIPDTVTFSETHTLTIFMSKSGGNVFSGDLTLFFHTQNDTAGAADTLLHYDQYTLNSSTDSITTNFTFNESCLDGGDNIVVVWPSSSMQPLEVNGDSIYFHIVYEGVGIDENNHRQTMMLYPNPARSEVRLRLAFPEKVEQVRVLDVLGKEILRFGEAVKSFNVESLVEGIYFVEVKSRDGGVIVKKFFRY